MHFPRSQLQRCASHSSSMSPSSHTGFTSLLLRRAMQSSETQWCLVLLHRWHIHTWPSASSLIQTLHCGRASFRSVEVPSCNGNLVKGGQVVDSKLVGSGALGIGAASAVCKGKVHVARCQM